MTRDLTRVPFARALIHAGFRRDGTHDDPLLYVLRVGDRELDVQLWKDSRHRVSHSLISELPGRPTREPFLGKRMTTTPTEFTTLPAMWAAILTELSRTDHKPDDFGYRLGLGAATLLVAERRRQVEAEGWTPEHDDEHAGGELAAAAACYATGNNRLSVNGPAGPVFVWPWVAKWWKPKDRKRNLVRAGALIIAEIERLDRAASRADDAAWAAQREAG